MVNRVGPVREAAVRSRAPGVFPPLDRRVWFGMALENSAGVGF